MYCTRKVTEDIIWVGADNLRESMFEGVYPIPRGVSYNSYIILDEKTALLDTADKSISERFMQNVRHTLNGRKLDYLIIHHMEPDHSANIMRILRENPETRIVCTQKSIELLNQFFDTDMTDRARIVGEGETLSLGRHLLTFYAAPMVHWPEVMVSFDSATGILFSADAFGAFGALGGALFSDELNIYESMDDYRRYYSNIVGKYGPQVQALLKKAAKLDIKCVCPLHGPMLRGGDIGAIVGKYDKWSRYKPEEKGVLVVCGSIYGNTEEAAQILACLVNERGVRTEVRDVSVTHSSELISLAFRYSHIVLASATYNTGIFVEMENFLRDLAAHNIQNRTVAFIQNGSWWPASMGEMKKILENCKNITYLAPEITIKSSLSAKQIGELERLADAIAESIG